MEFTFNSTGKVISIKDGTGTLIGIAPSGDDEKKQAKQLVRDKCKQTAALLELTSDLHAFYLEFFNHDETKISIIRAELQAIGNDNVEDYKKVYPGNLTYFEPLNKSMTELDKKIYDFKSGLPSNTLQLIHTNIVNMFL